MYIYVYIYNSCIFWSKYIVMYLVKAVNFGGEGRVVAFLLQWDITFCYWDMKCRGLKEKE